MVDGLGSLSPSELEAMRSLSKQRLPVKSKHVEALIDLIQSIGRDAYSRGIDDSARLMDAAEEKAHATMERMKTSASIDLWAARADQYQKSAGEIRALKDTGV